MNNEIDENQFIFQIFCMTIAIHERVNHSFLSIPKDTIICFKVFSKHNNYSIMTIMYRSTEAPYKDHLAYINYSSNDKSKMAQ